jgi:hypothetical protein
MDIKRLLPLSGIVFVVFVLVTSIALNSDAPTSTATGAEVASYYAENEIAQGIGSFLIAAAVLFLVLFAVALASLPPHDDKRLWERVLVGGSVLAGTIFLITGIVNFALVDGATNDASEEALQALSLFLGNNWVGFNAGLGVMMIGAAGTLLARPRAHAALGWTALVLGIALFIPFVDFIALLLTATWIIVASVVLFRATKRDVAVAVPAA